MFKSIFLLAALFAVIQAGPIKKEEMITTTIPSEPEIEKVSSMLGSETTTIPAIVSALMSETTTIPAVVSALESETTTLPAIVSALESETTTLPAVVSALKSESYESERGEEEKGGEEEKLEEERHEEKQEERHEEEKLKTEDEGEKMLNYQGKKEGELEESKPLMYQAEEKHEEIPEEKKELIVDPKIQIKEEEKIVEEPKILEKDYKMVEEPKIQIKEEEKIVEEPKEEIKTDDSHVEEAQYSRKVRELEKVQDSIAVDSVIAKLCESSSNFKYYQPHPTDIAKYVQCDPWGTPEIKSCEPGHIWDSWALKCNLPSDIKNMTIDMTLLEKNIAAVTKVNCNQAGESVCLNGGECKIVDKVHKCVCSANFTGDLCEVKVDDCNIYSEIISNTFSLDKYKKDIKSEIVSQVDDLTYYETIKNQLDKETYDEIIKYLSIYKKNGEIRYDIVINSLIENILQDIYPDVFYLSLYNVSSESVISVVRMIPNLLSYAKYSSERYEQVFFQYVKVLEKLQPLLNSSWPSIEEEAFEYSRLAGLYMNRSIAIYNETINKEKKFNGVTQDQVQWSEVEIKEKMKVEYKQTLVASNKLFENLSKFQNEAIAAMKLNPDLHNMTLSAAKIEGCEETIKLLEEVSLSSALIWDSLINFGFWFITNVFAAHRV